MNFHEEDDGDIISSLLLKSCVTNLLNILLKSRRQLLWVKGEIHDHFNMIILK